MTMSFPPFRRDREQYPTAIRIRNALHAKENFFNHEDIARRFMQKDQAEHILAPYLLDLVRELLVDDTQDEAALAVYMQQTLDDERVLILAMILYDVRWDSLGIYKKWLNDPGSQPDFPSDKQLPLLREEAERGFSDIDVDYVMENQGIFAPFVIRQNVDHILTDDNWQPAENEFVMRSSLRKPYVGKPKRLGEGSAGSVSKISIAARHWAWYEKHPWEESGQWKTAEKETAVAVKTFRKDRETSAEEATKNFRDEINFLRGLKDDRGSHENIIFDLGSITYSDPAADDEYLHELFFPLAICNLHELLLEKNLPAGVSNFFPKPLSIATKSCILGMAIDVIGALDFLHHLDRMHRDIKPHNILVFLEKSKAGQWVMVWKLADFNLSKTKPAGTASLQELSKSPKKSQQSFADAIRVHGAFQAPEVREGKGEKSSQRSDVFSIGGALMVIMSYLEDCVDGVERLHRTLRVHPQGHNDNSFLAFYCTPDMEEWSRATGRFDLGSDVPTDKVDQAGLTVPKEPQYVQVALNPNLLLWMVELRKKARQRDDSKDGEGDIVNSILDYLTKHVLNVNRKLRVDAKKFKDAMVKVRAKYDKLKVACAVAEAEVAIKTSSGVPVIPADARASSVRTGANLNAEEQSGVSVQRMDSFARQAGIYGFLRPLHDDPTDTLNIPQPSQVNGVEQVAGWLAEDAHVKTAASSLAVASGGPEGVINGQSNDQQISTTSRRHSATEFLQPPQIAVTAPVAEASAIPDEQQLDFEKEVASIDHSRLCAAITNGDYHTLKTELHAKATDPNQECPRCSEYPIIQVLRNRDEGAERLKLLLKSAPSLPTINMKGNNFPLKPLAIACEGSGNHAALKALFDHQDLQFDNSIYVDRAKHLRGRAKSLMDQEHKAWRKDAVQRVASSSTEGSNGTQQTSASKFSILWRRNSPG